MKYLFSVILLALSFPVFGQEPKQSLIPAKIAVVAGQPVCIDASTAKGKIKWIFEFDRKNTIQDGKKLYFASTTDGVYKVMLISYADEADAVCEITVGAAVVPNGPDGSLATIMEAIRALTGAVSRLDARIKALEGAKPPPSGLLKHMSFVGPELNAAALVVNNDAGLRAMLKAAGVSIHVVKNAELAAQSAGFKAAATKAGGPPCVVLQDVDGNVLSQGPLASVAAVQELCSQFIRR